MSFKRVLPFVSLLVLQACQSVGIAVERAFVPQRQHWPRWKTHDPRSTAAIDHSLWSGFLARNLRLGGDGIARVAYQRVSAPDRAALTSYLRHMQAVPIDGYRRAEQLAYWINLYNALTVDVVLRHHPVASILDIDLTPGPLSRGPWDAKQIRVAETPLSLNDIEHRIARPIWDDPRIHYAFNSAAIGCLNLADTAYTGATIEMMLDAAARAYVTRPRGVAIDEDGVTLSKIYGWYAEDFGGEVGLLGHLRKYARQDHAQNLATLPIKRYVYDWRLNDALR